MEGFSVGGLRRGGIIFVSFTLNKQNRIQTMTVKPKRRCFSPGGTPVVASGT